MSKNTYCCITIHISGKISNSVIFIKNNRGGNNKYKLDLAVFIRTNGSQNVFFCFGYVAMHCLVAYF